MTAVITPIGRLSWELYLECPHCNETVDVVRADEENELANVFSRTSGTRLKVSKSIALSAGKRLRWAALSIDA